MSKIFYVFLVLAAFGAEAFVFVKMTKPQKPKIDIVHSQESVQPEEPKQTSIILTGDIMLGRSVMTESIKLNNYKYPFEKVVSPVEIKRGSVFNPRIEEEEFINKRNIIFNLYCFLFNFRTLFFHMFF